MAVPGLTFGWGSSDDGPLRPSPELDRQIAQMHRNDAQDSADIYAYAMADPNDGRNSAHSMKLGQRWSPRSHTDKPPRPNMTVEQEIFHSVLFQDE